VGGVLEGRNWSKRENRKRGRLDQRMVQGYQRGTPFIGGRLKKEGGIIRRGIRGSMGPILKGILVSFGHRGVGDF